MDLSILEGALASKSYEKIAGICDEIMLQAASQGVFSPDAWPYAIHLLAHIYVNDINSARFLWKSIPSTVKESKPEISGVWNIGKNMWMRDYEGVQGAIRGVQWSDEIVDMVENFCQKYTNRIFELLSSAYSTISVDDTARFLGTSNSMATDYVVQRGWSVDHATGMLIVKRQPVATEQKLDPRKLQRLTEYVFHLEH